MKIGIMTFHAALNYGAALQAFALQTHLQKIGHDPFFINYHYGALPRKGLLRWIGRTPSITFAKVNNEFRKKPFIHFQKEYLTVGRDKFFNHAQLQSNPPKAGAYICGSDQIWNPHFMKLEKDKHAFWLDFGGAEVRRIAYAPSFGTRELSREIRFQYGNHAKRFDAISVREKDGVELAKGLGRHDAVWVPDPTLLLDQDEYARVEKRIDSSQKPYLFSYQLGTDNAALALRVNANICSTLGLIENVTYRRSLIRNILHNGYFGPGEWLFKLRQSCYVVTNSFHATVFSLLFHKPFIVLLRSGRDAEMNSRVTSLLNVVGLRNRAIKNFDYGRIEELCHEEVDWNHVYDKVRQFREVGFRFLREALS